MKARLPENFKNHSQPKLSSRPSLRRKLRQAGTKRDLYFKNLGDNTNCENKDFSPDSRRGRNDYRFCMGLSLIFLFFITNLQPAAAQHKPALPGDWEGGISLQGNQLPIKTHFNKNDDNLGGTIDIQGATLPLQNIHTTDQDSVFFEFTTSVNVAKFEGAFKNDSTITGQYLQAGQQFPFELKRNKPQADEMEELSKAPLPYNHEDLIIKNDSINIAGTLTWPKGEQANQLVIMISGSGAQDRDEEIYGFKPFAQIADHLTQNGIATFRFDDRGIGQSTGNFAEATLDLMVSDIEAIISGLLDKSDHSFEEIILLGHSQGGLVGGKAAAENDAVDKLILMASPGVSLQEVLRFQVRQAFSQGGVDSALVEEEIAARENLIQSILDDKNVAQAQENYRQKFAEIQLATGVDSVQASAVAQQQAQQLAAAFNSPQLKSFVQYDPVTDLRNIDIPVLVLFGKKDTQITIDMHRAPIEQALEKSDGKTVIVEFKDANHLFQKAETGAASEYASLKKEFVGDFTATIADWIKK